MNNASDREVALFNGALQLAVEQRARYLDEACAGDEVLRLKIEALLRVHDEVGTFLENPTQEAELSAVEPPGLSGTVRVSASSIEKTGERIGQYKLLQQIGEGGCGVVYLAEQTEPVRRNVALKVIKLGMDTKHVIARFEAERQALALMDHPNIAKVLDAGATGTGRPFFVMELVRGIKITDYCDQNNLTTEERLKLFTQVCRAIQHAHQKGIIHRDIKPSNILVADHDGVPVPKVIDFGIAKATTDQRLTDKTLFTALEQFIGTPAYMSPEQARLSGLDIDTRTDIYSLGVLLYELLTGKTPFDATKLLAAGLEEMRRTILEQEPERPSTALSTMLAADLTIVAKHRQSDAPKLVHLLRGDLDWIVMKALEKDRTRRYETATGLAKDVQRHLDNELVTARPPSNVYRFQKLVRRNKLAFLAASVVTGVLVLGAVISTWQAIRATRAEREQSRLRQEAEQTRNIEATLRTQAETEAAKSRQVAQFLTAMLEGVGPSMARGRDTAMLREILDKTAITVGTELKDQPEVQAELEGTIGRVYYELAEDDKAEAMQRDALAKRRRLFGQENLETATSLYDLAYSLCREDKLGEAEPMARTALAVRQRLLGSEHREVADSLNILANILRSEGKTSDAEMLYRQALAMQKRLKNDEGMAKELNNLAMMARDRGSVVEAESMLRESLALYQRVLSPEHPDLAMSLNNLAETLRGERKLGEAETEHREALALRKKLFGTEHPLAEQSLGELLWVLEDEGKLDEAETMARGALAMARLSVTNDFANLEDQLAGLANVLRHQKKPSEAKALYQEALASARQFGGNDPSRLENRLADVATCDVILQNYPEAESLLREGLASARLWATNDPGRLEDRLTDVASILQREKKHPESEALFREALASARQNASNDTSRLERFLGNTAGSLRDQMEYPQAEALFREALTMARQFAANDPERKELRVADLADSLRSQRKYTEAEPLFREALASARLWATNDLGRLEIRTVDVASVLRAQQKFTEAEALSREALVLARQFRTNNDDSADLAYRTIDLAETLEQNGRRSEAESCYREGLDLQRKLFGNENSGLSVLLQNLADLLVREDMTIDAEAVYREAVAIRKKFFGNGNPDLAGSLHNLADVLVKEDKLAEAEGFYREALSIRRKFPGDDALETWPQRSTVYLLCSSRKANWKRPTPSRPRRWISARKTGLKNPTTVP